MEYVDPAEAIAELKELSTQIDTVTLAARDGTVVAVSYTHLTLPTILRV